MYKTSKIAFSLATTSLGFLINITSASAAIIKFDLGFFDGNNTQVGAGQFSYDDNTSTCFETSFGGDCNSSDEYKKYDTILVENALTDFSAVIDGENWNGYYGHWWSDETSGQLPGEQSVSRYGIDISNNRWFFGDPYFGERAMIMDISESSNTFGTGSCLQQILPENGGEPIMGSGFWQATKVEANPSPIETETVPEPSTVLGFLIAVGLVGYSKRSR